MQFLDPGSMRCVVPRMIFFFLATLWLALSHVAGITQIVQFEHGSITCVGEETKQLPPGRIEVGPFCKSFLTRQTHDT